MQFLATRIPSNIFVTSKQDPSPWTFVSGAVVLDTGTNSVLENQAHAVFISSVFGKILPTVVSDLTLFPFDPNEAPFSKRKAQRTFRFLKK